MAVRSVHWHEGMFLWPQQMQQAERFVAHQVHLSGKWNTHYNWGLRSFDLDLDALANFRFVVRSLQARLRDGSMVTVPEDGNLPALELKETLERNNSATILLAVPKMREGKPNVGERAAAQAGSKAAAGAAPASTAEGPGEARFSVKPQDLEDENTGADIQPVQVRMLNVKLLLATQPHAGYEVLPVARVAKSSEPDALPALDTAYIPPLLACDAWKPLRDGLLQVIYDRFGALIGKLASHVVSHGISFDTRNEGDALRLGQLQSLNEAYALFRVMAFADGVHPLEAYLELCRVAGRLAIFDTTSRRAPLLPRYDHDDLAGCFYRVKVYLDSIKFEEPLYEERPFISQDQRIQVALEPKWLEPMWDMFVGVKSPLKAEDCIRLLTRPGHCNMKIGSSSRVDRIFIAGDMGLKFTPCNVPPRALPSQPDLVYFQVSRDSQKAEWQSVQQSLTLAIRLNEYSVIDEVQGQQILAIHTGSQKTTMQFTLYLAPRET